jgi:hypothetical protein
MCGNNDWWQFNARIGKKVQAVECLADIRRRDGASSVFLVFDSEQPGATTAHGGCAMTLYLLGI